VRKIWCSIVEMQDEWSKYEAAVIQQQNIKKIYMKRARHRAFFECSCIFGLYPGLYFGLYFGKMASELSIMPTPMYFSPLGGVVITSKLICINTFDSSPSVNMHRNAYFHRIR